MGKPRLQHRGTEFELVLVGRSRNEYTDNNMIQGSDADTGGKIC